MSTSVTQTVHSEQSLFASGRLMHMPDQWQLKLLGDIFYLKNGFAFSSRFFCDSGPIVLTPGNFRLDGGLYFDSRHTKHYCGPYEPAMTFEEGNLLIVMTDLTPECNLLGKPAIVQSSELILHNQRIGKVVFRDHSVNMRFLFYVLLSRGYLDRVREQATGSTVRHTSNRSIYGIAVLLPPPHEQNTIASALSDMDDLIGALEKQIAKKRAIKLGAMQQLITGEIRLPGFQITWERKPLKQIAPLQRGFDLPTYRLSQGPYPVVYSNGILHHHSSFMVKGPGVVTGRSGTIGNVFFIEKNYWPHNTSLWVTSFRGNNPKFVFYLYSMIGFERFGTGSGVPTLNRNDVHSHEVRLPPDPAEQAAIATILSNMDSEIAALERRRDKAKAIKQGMMQALLTGRIRLVKPGAQE